MRGFPPGVYDLLLTRALRQELDRLGLRAATAELDPQEAIEYLAREVADRARRILRQEAEGEAAEPRLLERSRRMLAAADDPDEPTLELLKAVQPADRPSGATAPEPPILPLSFSQLVTNQRQVNFLEVVASELRSADRVDLICPFIGYQGVLRLVRHFERLGPNLRILTTTYLGATSARALRLLAELGARIRIAYESAEQHTSLHAKAWVFHRDTGFTTATIGSSNLSTKALVDGLEWNVRLGAKDAPYVIQGLIDTFERLWNQPDRFVPFDPNRDMERLVRSIDAQRSGAAPEPTFFDIRPYPHQEEALELLRLSRIEGRRENLLVAATGTGKTVVAALDYANLAREYGRRPKLLFVAHRHEILRQSRDTYRAVLRDSGFGELLSGQDRPATWTHVFGTVQSLSQWSDQQLAGLDTEVLVIDEFHHAEAATYRRILDRVRRKELLALTATPERTDGVNVADWFGGPTYELRLWHALDRGLLCPFRYWGIDDGTDLSGVAWDRGRYDVGQLERLYVERGQPRVETIVRNLLEKVEDPSRMRAVAFCVSVRHAEFMAEELRKAGLRAAALHASLEPGLREQTERRFRSGDLNLVCTVDLFNEGVDVPEIDTVLFLRPTESALLFTQQLGRGLRRHPDKSALTVLDFVGRQNQKFRYDLRLRALTGLTRKGLEESARDGFLKLPPGCDVQLDRITQERVLEALRQAVPRNLRDLADEYRRLSASGQPVPLRRFLEETGIEPGDLYRGGRTLLLVRRRATGDDSDLPERHERLERLLHVNDRLRARAYVEAARGERSDVYRRQLLALFHDHASDPFALDDETVRELDELLGFLTENAGPSEPVGRSAPDPSGLEDLPFCLHRAYSRDEIVAPFRDNPASFREGVLFDKQRRIGVNLVTLNKSDREFSPTTRYADVLLSPVLLQWESQSTTSLVSETGRRITNPANWRQLFFVRASKTDADGRTAPYWCLGWGRPIRHEGEKPIRILYGLFRAVPDSLDLPFEDASG